MKKVEIVEGVAAMYNGEFWGCQLTDGYSTSMGFGDFDKAKISKPRYCTKPTDMTWNPEKTNGHNHEYNLLKKAKLVKVRKTITTELEILE